MYLDFGLASPRDRTKLWGLSPLGILVDAGYTGFAAIDIWWPVERSFVPIFIALCIRRTSLVDIIHCEEPPRGYRTRSPSRLQFAEAKANFISLQMTKDLHTYICMGYFASMITQLRSGATLNLLPHFSPSCIPSDSKAAAPRRALGLLSPYGLCSTRGDWDDINPCFKRN